MPKTKSEPPPPPPPPPQTSSFKKVFRIGLIIFIIYILIKALPFTVMYLDSIGRSDADLSRVAPSPGLTSAPSPKITPKTTTAPVSQIQPLSIASVPADWKNISLNCEDTGFAPPHLRAQNFYCRNVYQVNPATLLSEFQASGKSRLVLYGKNIYYDCPLNVSKTTNMITKCFNGTVFLDSWQIPQMTNIFSVNLSKKLYVYFGQSKNEVGSLCGLATASACFDHDHFALILNPPRSEADFYKKSFAAAVFEGSNHEIEYSFTLTLSTSCYVTDVHEMIHFFNNQFFGFNIARTWVEEGMAYSLTPYINKILCPPGPSFTNVFKKENGSSTKLNSFDLTSLNLHEPLDSALESYASGNRCRKAVYLELNRTINSKGLGLIPNFYREIKNLPKTYAANFADALRAAEGNPAGLADFFRSYGCGSEPEPNN